MPSWPSMLPQTKRITRIWFPATCNRIFLHKFLQLVKNTNIHTKSTYDNQICAHQFSLIIFIVESICRGNIKVKSTCSLVCILAIHIPFWRIFLFLWIIQPLPLPLNFERKDLWQRSPWPYYILLLSPNFCADFFKKTTRWTPWKWDEARRSRFLFSWTHTLTPRSRSRISFLSKRLFWRVSSKERKERKKKYFVSIAIGKQMSGLLFTQPEKSKTSLCKNSNEWFHLSNNNWKLWRK